MQANRRHFLSLLGVGAASAPLVAKAATEAQVMSLTSLGRQQNGLLGGVTSSANGDCVPNTQSGNVSSYVHAQGYIKTFGKLPDFVDENIRQRAKDISYLDVDIASKKSWSLSVKVLAQRERNYQNEIQRYVNSGRYELGQSAFQKLTGFHWPW